MDFTQAHITFWKITMKFGERLEEQSIIVAWSNFRVRMIFTHIFLMFLRDQSFFTVLEIYFVLFADEY